MEPAKTERRLAAILLADVVGYSRMMGRDEEATLQGLNACRALFREHLSRAGGRVINAPGDSILAEFGTVSDAVACAVEIQTALADRNASVPEPQRMRYRIGINLGDVIVQGDEIYGDGVNIAARLQTSAAPGGICVSGAVHDSIEGKLDFQFDYLGRRRVKNIATPVRVYRVVTEAEAQAGLPALRRLRSWRPGRRLLAAALVAVVLAGAAGAGGWWWLRSRDPVLAMPSGPVVAVLPFHNAGLEADQELFSDGITEELITELARYDNVFVLSRNCTFPYKGQTVDVRLLREELGADYVLGGSVRRAGGQVRVNAEFVDADDGRNLWAETYDRELTPDNLFAVQSEISEQVVRTIGGSYGVVYRAGLERIQAKPPEHLTSYECVLQARRFFGGDFSLHQHALARECLERATERDPDYGAAWAWLAGLYAVEHALGYNAREDSGERALTAARRAVALSPDSHRAQAHLALALFLRKSPDYRAVVEATLRLNPNDPEIVALMGHLVGFGGDWARGRALLDKSIALTPNPPAVTFLALSHRAFLDGHDDDALEYALRANLPGYYGVHVARARGYARLGRTAEAAGEVARALDLYPGYPQFAAAFWQRATWTNADAVRLLQGDREAGFPIPETAARVSAARQALRRGH